jgi:hypothetical protein
VSDSRCNATPSPDTAGRRDHGTHGLLLFPSSAPGPGDRAASAIVRLLLGPSEWMLIARPLGQQVLRAAPTNLTGPYVPPLPGRFAIVLVSGSLGPGLGCTALHYQRGQTWVYCHINHMVALAARVLPALAEQAIGYATDPEARITVTRISYQQFLEGPFPGEDLLADVAGEQILAGALHPAYAAMVRRRDVALRMCADLISADLAGDLGLLWTAHARCLSQLGRRGPESQIPQLVPAARRAAP